MWLKRTDAAALLILAVPFCYLFFFKDSIDENLPVHWNISGKADRWESKEGILSFLLITTLIALGVYLLIRFLPKIDPKRSAKLSQNVFNKVGLAIVVFMASLNFMILYGPSHKYSSMGTIFFLLSLFFAFLGNVMYNIKPNYFVGIRLPWTLESDENWKQTHRLAGKLWFIGGLISALLTLILPPTSMAPIFLILVIGLVAVPSAYSYYFFRKFERQK
jgi:uncharacterized membrane protein